MQNKENSDLWPTMIWTLCAKPYGSVGATARTLSGSSTAKVARITRSQSFISTREITNVSPYKTRNNGKSSFLQSFHRFLR